MSTECRENVDGFLREAEEDCIGLWQVIKEAKRFAEGEPLAIRAVTLDIVRELHALGLEAGDPPYTATGYKPWPNHRMVHSCLVIPFTDYVSHA